MVSFDVTANGGRLVMTRGGAGCNRVECWKVRPAGSFAPLWSLRDGKPVGSDEPYLLNQAAWFTNAVAFHPNGKILATAESRSGGAAQSKPLVVLRDGKNGAVLAELGQSATDFDVRLALAPDGRSVFAWERQMLERWDVAAGRRTSQCPAPGRSNFGGLVVHPAGRFVLTISGDGQARSWDPVDLAPIQALKLGAGNLHAVAFSSDGTLAAAGGDKGQVIVWEVEA